MALAGLAALAAAAVVFSLGFGAARLDLGEVVTALRGRGDPAAVTIVRELRLPRAILAALVGGGLALAIQAFTLGPNPTPGGYFMTMGFYVFLAGLGAAALSGRYHQQSREIVWGDEYGSEVGRTAVDKFRARTGPAAVAPKARKKKTEVSGPK